MPSVTSVVAHKCDGCDKTFPSPEGAVACEARHANDIRTAPLIAARDAAKVVYDAATKALQDACKHNDKKVTGRDSRLNQGDGYDNYVFYACPHCGKDWEEFA